MAVLITRTREEIRVSVGENLGAVYSSTMTSGGSTTTGVDATLANADDYYNGRWIWFTSGDNDEEERVVDDYTGSTTTWTTRGDALGTATADGDTYEMWDEDIRPSRVHNFIERAVQAIPRKGAPPVTSYAFHTGGLQREFSLPTTIAGIQRISYRSWAKRETVHNCDVAFDELVDSNVTAAADDEDLREGAASNRFQLDAALSTGNIASGDISSLDLSGFTHLEFWTKTTVAASAGDLVLRLSNSANGGSGTEDLNVPALVADTWEFHRVALANPHLDTAIISVALRQATDIGAAYVWIDDIEAVRDDSETFTELSRDQWWVNRDERKFVLSELAIADARYALLKLEGRQKPTELTSDGTSCDVDPEWVINYATSLAIRASGDRRAENREAAHIEADRWMAFAVNALAKTQTPQGVRWLSD